ncbi:MAG: hypothetical protein J5629_11665 [Muribaculaceae bacterium]|nr:hypothetical protein [Muribaculaceae bacterium]
MKKIRKTLNIGLITAFFAAVLAITASSCNRMMTYEDGMFDYNEVYDDDATNDTFQINSEIDNDDTERY